MNKGSVSPVKLYIRNDEWAVDVRRTVAYRALCDCEWRGPSRRSYSKARADLREHRAAHQRPSTAASPNTAKPAQQ